MEEVYGQAAGFEVIAEDVGVVVLFGGGDALLLLKLVDGGELVAKTGGGFKLLGFGGDGHAGAQRAFEFDRSAFKEELGVAHRGGIKIEGSEPFDTRAEAAMDVVLQAGAGMIPR